MGLIKQPNGKYCNLDSYGRANFVNYTEQDVINLYIENAKRDMKKAGHFGEVINCMTSGKMLKAERVIDDKVLESMGFDKPYKELVKFVPLRPTNQGYAACDFTTYGKCPNCGCGVQDGMGGTDEKCRVCGQLLKW